MSILGTYQLLSYPNYADYRAQNDVFVDLGVYTFPNGVSLVGSGKPTPVNVQVVSGNYFSLLGVEPALGEVIARLQQLPGVSANERVWGCRTAAHNSLNFYRTWGSS